MERFTDIVVDYGGIIGTMPNSEIAAQLSRVFDVDREITRQTITKNVRNLQELHLPEKKFWEMISNGIPVDNVDDLKQVWVGTIENSTRLDFGVMELLEDLSRSYRLTLLSNTTQLYIYSPFSSAIAKLFSEKIYSCDVGFRKPEKEIYDLALARLNVRPDECIIIDDEPENLVYPSSRGMGTILYKNLADLRSEIGKRLP